MVLDVEAETEEDVVPDEHLHLRLLSRVDGHSQKERFIKANFQQGKPPLAIAFWGNEENIIDSRAMQYAQQKLTSVVTGFSI